MPKGRHLNLGCNNYYGKDRDSEARNKTVSRIMDSLQKHMPQKSHDERLKIACRLEKMTPTDQRDYLLSLETKDWRSTLGSEARKNSRMHILQKHVPQKSPNGMKIACRLEEDIYKTAKDQKDYHRRIYVEIEIEFRNNPTLSKGNYYGNDVAIRLRN